MFIDFYNRMLASVDKDNNDPIARKDNILVVRAHAKKFEEIAKRKEMQLKYKQKTSVDDVLDINEMLIGAIESKLDLLKGINA